MTKTYAIEVLENTRIQLLDQIDVLNSLGIGNFNEKRKELAEKLNNVKASIKTLNENRGIKINSESGTVVLGNGCVKFVGNVEFSPTKPASEQNVTQNITINIEPSNEFDVAKFAEQMMKTLKRQQGV